MTRPILRHVLPGVLAVLLSLAMPAAIAQPAGPMPGMGGPTEVGVMTLDETEVPFLLTVPGRAVAYEEVAIRPRVSGTIAEILYSPGQDVAEGDVLFRIEDDSYAAEVASAEASVARAEAALRAAQATVERYESLAGTGVTAQDLETARVSVLQAEADLRAAEAVLQTARLNLEWTELRSPIAGIADIPSVSVGALVTANQGEALATVTRIDPIFVDVGESSRRLAEIRRRIEEGRLQAGTNLGIRLTLETGEIYEAEGEMITPGMRVSQTTGTLAFRLRFPNPERRILPGQFLRIDVQLGTIRAVLVPQGVTQRNAAGELTAFVAEDGIARQRVLTEEGSYGNAWIVTEGIEPGETVIVDGLSRLRDGAEVTTVPVEITADGTIHRTDGGSDEFLPVGTAPAIGATPPAAADNGSDPGPGAATDSGNRTPVADGGN